MKAYGIFLKVLKYTLLTCLIIIALAVACLYFFQDNIIRFTFAELNKNLATKIEVDRDVNVSLLEKFPAISVRLNNVRVYETFPGSKEKLASLRSLSFAFNAWDLINGKYVLEKIYAEKGNISIRINQNGIGNYFIFKSDTTNTQPEQISFDFREIVLDDVLLNYQNEALHQDYSIHVLQLASSLRLNEEKSWFIGLDGTLFVHHIGIGGNEYCREKEVVIKSRQEFHEDRELFKILPTVLKVEGSEFQLSGFYEGRKKKEIALQLKAEKCTITTLLSLLPGNLGKELSVYRSSGNLYFDASIEGGISVHESPRVNILFGFKDASFSHPGYDKKIKKASLTGSYSNGESHNLGTSHLNLKDINGIFDGKNFQGSFSLENFEDPAIRASFRGLMDLEFITRFFPQAPLAAASGELDLDVHFNGRIADLKTTDGKEKVSASGSVGMKNISFQLKDFPLPFREINGTFHFNKHDLVVDQLSGAAGHSDLRLKGSFKNFIPRIISGKHVLTADADIQSDQIDLDELLLALEKKSAAASTATEKEPETGRFPYLEDYKCRLKCSVRQLQYKKVRAKNIQGVFEFSQPVAYLKDVQFTMAGGKGNFQSLVYFASKDRIELNARGKIANIYIDSVFYIFDNFDQNFIRDKNLKGQFTGDIRVFVAMNRKLEIYPSSVTADIDALIVKGELNNFEPMKKLSRFIDEKQLENIRFSEIRNKIFIENKVITIPEMQIKSNVSSISVLGTHTFDQAIDYKLTIPVKDFKKRHPDKDEAFGAVEEDNKGNSLIFLTIKGTTNNYKIAYDKKRTAKKIKEDLKKEKKELQSIFKNKKPQNVEENLTPGEYKYFDF